MSAASVLFKHAKQLRGGKRFSQFVRECREEKKLDFADVKIGELAHLAYGDDVGGGLSRDSRRQAWVQEATEATDATAFRDVISSMSTASLEDGYKQAASGVVPLFGVFETPNQPEGEHQHFFKANSTGQVQAVAPGTEYPRAGQLGYKVAVPEPSKFGLIAALTIETVKSNQTRQFLKDQLDVGRAVGAHQVKAFLRCMFGITNTYKRNGTLFNTYQIGGAWTNGIDDFDITRGPGEFDRGNQMFDRMLHPVTNEPIPVMPDTVLGVGAQIFQVKSIVRATEIRVTAGATTTIGANPLIDQNPTLLTDKFIRPMLLGDGGLTAIQADTNMLFGQMNEAFMNRQIEPFKVFETNEAQIGYPDFFQDIVYAAKGRWWGVPFVMDPMKVLRLRKMA